MGAMQGPLEDRSNAVEFMLVRSSAEGHRHAFQCRDLAESCLTKDGERILRAMAEEYARLAGQLEQWGY